jgi:hypothetical protein
MAEVFLGVPELVPTGCRSDLLDTLDEIGSKSLLRGSLLTSFSRKSSDSFLVLNFPFLRFLGAVAPPRIFDSLAPGLRGLREV